MQYNQVLRVTARSSLSASSANKQTNKNILGATIPGTYSLCESCVLACACEVTMRSMLPVHPNLDETRAQGDSASLTPTSAFEIYEGTGLGGIRTYLGIKHSRISEFLQMPSLTLPHSRD